MDLADLLDLDADVLHEYMSDLMTWIHDLADGGTRRILDLGSGTGTGALALAARFPDAEVTAVDVSEEMLDRVTGKARDRGLAGRIRTVRADLDEAWPSVGTVDLIWASASLHHMADPGRVLADAFAAIRPGGLLVAAELGSFPRFLTDEAGAALEDRCHAMLDRARAEALPHIHADWGSLLTRAGFTVEAHRRFDIHLTPPLPAATGRYAYVSLSRMRHGLGDRLSAADQATMDSVLAGIADRDDLTVRSTRTVWAARRP
jgi:SAM-dependent methyltransferase